jgi:two-component system, OmpR family, response regulator
MAETKVRAIVVDDEDAARNMMTQALSRTHYQVDSFGDPEEALKNFERGKYQLAILDIKMPKMNGVELLGKMREVDSEITPIIITGYPEVTTAAESMRLGSFDYIMKPFTADEFVESIDRVATSKGYLVTDEQQFNEALGRRLREQREKLGLTLRELSAKIDLSVSQLSQIELGKNAASLTALRRIVRALGMKLSDVFESLS